MGRKIVQLNRQKMGPKKTTKRLDPKIGQFNRRKKSEKKTRQINQTNNWTIYIGQKIGQTSDLKLD